MHATVTAAIAVGVILLLIFISVTLFNVWRRVVLSRAKSEEKTLVVNDADNELESLVKEVPETVHYDSKQPDV